MPPAQVSRVAAETGAIPYDIPGVELSHVGEGCSVDSFVAKYGLDNDAAIVTVAAIVRGRAMLVCSQSRCRCQWQDIDHG